MTEAETPSIPPTSPRRSLARRLCAAAAVAAAVALAVCLAVRPLTSPDLGYHLAYGEQFLDHGRIVDHNDYLYTLPGPGEPRSAPGPGCWYDEQGRYRFANANWLTQVIMAGVHRLAGPDGLCVLQIALVAGIFLLTLATSRRLGTPGPLVAGGLLLAALTAYGRFNLRPEVFGYLMLAAQLWLLTRPRLGWGSVAGVTALQVLFVNLHSYFLLALAMTGAMLVEAVLHWCWPPRDVKRPAARRRAMRVGIVLGGQLLACLVNPWTWRLAVLPVQTLVFLRANKITAGPGQPHAHPWTAIGEFFPPFSEGFWQTGNTATYAFCVLLAVAAIGVFCCLWRRRWAWALIVAAMTATSLSMRRNIAPAAVVILPLALPVCWAVLGRLRHRLAARERRVVSVGFAAGVIILAAAIAIRVVTQGFYYREKSPIRFGWGLSPMHLPLAAARQLSDVPPGRVWTDYNTSSNIHYFVSPHPPVPILTNTWAYPPAVMQDVLDCSQGLLHFAEVERRYAPDAVALQNGYTSGPLIGQLSADPAWSVTLIGARHVLFRKNAPADLMITVERFDTDEFIARLTGQDPLPAAALYAGGMTLYQLGWDWHAAGVFAATVEHDPQHYEAWNMRGICLATAGEMLLRQTGNPTLLRDAITCFRRALQIEPDYQPARENLYAAEARLR